MADRLRDLHASRALAFVVAAALLAAASGCSRKKSPAIEYMPNMAYGPRLAAQHEDPLRPGFSVQRPPVPGTVPRDFTPYRYAQGDTAQAATDLTNPLPRTAEVMARGRKVYMTTCVVCHGELGDGQGYIVPIYPTPPQLFSDKVRSWSDGRIFHVITRGQNLMPSYAAQILPEDRWAAVHYVRALQRAAHPLPSDLAAAGVVADSGAAGAPAGARADTAAARSASAKEGTR